MYRTVDQLVQGFDKMFKVLGEQEKLEEFADKFQTLMLKHRLQAAVHE